MPLVINGMDSPKNPAAIGWHMQPIMVYNPSEVIL